MNGIGNQFTIIDLRTDPFELSPEIAATIAGTLPETICDQLITLENDKDNDVFMGVWNRDGSVVETCGNAARCVASLILEGDPAKKTIEINTRAGSLSAHKAGKNRITVNMGTPKFGWREIPLAEQFEDTRYIDIKLGPIDNPVLWGPSAVNVGNPHCIFFTENMANHDLSKFGPMIENHPLFPERANVSLAQVNSAHALDLQVWERGVGLTKACGTAACASVVAAHRRRLTKRTVTVSLPGGDLAIEWRDDDVILMTGEVCFDGEGQLPMNAFAKDDGES